jgi:hypothetical protein
MNGPEHYREAERLINEVGGHDLGAMAEAQVHATLALTAASVRIPGTGDSSITPDRFVWREALQ